MRSKPAAPERQLTVGASKLRQLTETTEARRAVAASLHVSEQCVINWRNGIALPRLDMAFRLEDVLRIKARSWMQAPEARAAS